MDPDASELRILLIALMLVNLAMSGALPLRRNYQRILAWSPPP
jgi:hypothetical protein